MTRSRSIAFLAGAAVIPITALAVGCGGSGGGNATAAAPPPKTTSTPAATVRVANTHLGKILVDSKGRTLYLFTKDSTGKSSCSGMCATFWPPLTAGGNPAAGRGAMASLVGTTRRSDGTSQVTYHGHPLYRFAKDTKPGEVNGEGVTAFGGSWFAVSPSGDRVSPPSKGSSAPAPAPKASPAPAPPPTPAPPPAPKASPPPAAPPAPKASPPPSNNGIPQNGGGDGDADNNGGPDDGDGGV
jgi:predicted lipoprotein with Yx(FWY)xxD motif